MRCLVLCFLVLINAEISSAQSLREAAERGSRTEGTLSVEYPALSVPQLVQLSELILNAQVISVEARLVSGDRMVATDYTLAPFRYLKGQPRGVNANSPKPTNPIVVRRPGGTLIEGETRFVTHVECFPPQESFSPGEHVIMFLVYNNETAVYELTAGPYAAFRVTKDGVMPMTKKARETRGDLPRPLASFLADVQQEIERKD